MSWIDSLNLFHYGLISVMIGTGHPCAVYMRNRVVIALEHVAHEG